MTLLLPAETSASLINTVHHAEFSDLCERVYRAGVRVDMALFDPPYGTTACSWDTIIPFDEMWHWLKKLVRPNGAIVITASQPFTSALVMSNPKWFRCEWVWGKTNGGGFLNANRQPLKRHENILVFSERQSVYYPEFGEGEPYRTRSASAGETTYDQTVAGWVTENDGKRYPTTILDFSNDTGLHPTQKPVDLFRYLIRTYTLPGQLVFDPTCGSGTTAIAARDEGRAFICGDLSSEYVDIARERLAKPFTPSFMPMLENTA